MIILLYKLYVGQSSPNKGDYAHFFVKIWIPINGTQQCGIGSPKIHINYTGLLVVNGTPGF